MPALAEAGRLTFPEMIAAELAPREGRWPAVTRIAIATTLTVAIAMIFQIPAPEYMAYVVFLISRDDRNATFMAALGGFAAATIAIVLTLVLSLVDIDEPAVRLSAMALATIIAMFTARTLALGQLTFLAGFMTVLLHSLIDQVPNTEVFTRVALWGWVIVGVPVVITLAMHALFGHDVDVTIRRTARKVLQELKGALIRGDFHRRLPRWRSILVPLLDAKQEAAGRAGHIGNEALVRLLEALTILEVVPPTSPAADREAWAAHVDAILHLLDGVDASIHSPADWDEFATSASSVALGDCLAGLRKAIASGESAASSSEPGRRAGPLVADAFTNPVYWQFALKTTVAVMAAYVLYMLLDWPGIRTAMVTCFFVALASLGETIHKLILRISGALIGGLIAGLCIVFVLPHLTDIGQLCFLVALVALGAAWIATSSEMLAYAGLQVAFAFLLGILQGYAPATDLTVLRDRIAGILLGNALITIVFSSLWPESVKTNLRNAVSDAMRSLASVLETNTAPVRARVVRALTRAEHFAALSALELRMLSSSDPESRRVPALSAVERLAGATFVATAAPFATEIDAPAFARFRDWMETAADRVAQNQKLPFVPHVDFPAGEGPGTRAIARRAAEELKSEICHVASASN